MEETKLTTTITSEEYKMLLFKLADANRLAGAVATDWFSSVGFSFNMPSNATLDALRLYDPLLYEKTKQKVDEIEAARKNAEPPSAPAAPIIQPGDAPGWPYQGIEITRETKGETT